MTFTNNNDDDNNNDKGNAYLLGVYISLTSGICYKKEEKFLPLWEKKDNEHNIETIYVVF